MGQVSGSQQWVVSQRRSEAAKSKDIDLICLLPESDWNRRRRHDPSVGLEDAPEEGPTFSDPSNRVT